MDQGYVALVFHDRKNIIVYEAYNPITDKFVDLYEEPYETARDIVLKERGLETQSLE